jgi:hypothetical protein
MRNATLILTLILVGCAIDGLSTEENGAAPTHDPEHCPGAGGGDGGGGADPNPHPGPEGLLPRGQPRAVPRLLRLERRQRVGRALPPYP